MNANTRNALISFADAVENYVKAHRPILEYCSLEDPDAQLIEMAEELKRSLKSDETILS